MVKEIMKKSNEIMYYKTNNILKDTCNIIESSKNYAYQSINIALVKRNWLIGYRIYEEELKNQTRADYGLEIIKELSKDLIEKYGEGFDKISLYRYLIFYKYFSDLFYLNKIGNNTIISMNSNRLLSWSHYRTLIRVHDEDARNWYMNEAINEVWSVRTLSRNISSQYYYRVLKTHGKSESNKDKNKSYDNNKLEFIKNPVTLEFLGIPKPDSFYESDLEESIINNLQKFMIELGKGYAFVARQQHIKTEKEDYYVDLVFYNYILKCFVLIDLKTSKITHQDVGQMDMYIRMYDEFKKCPDDNPTIGIILCSDTDEDIAKFSILNDSDKLYATKYLLYMPTIEELRREIETQKALFYQQKEANS